jgi:hypothetical protein
MSEKTLTRRQALLATGGIVAAVSGVAATAAHAEFQPMMQAAMNSLSMARAQLINATADKGGFRLAALNYVNQAITQVQLGIAWDDAN